MVQVKKKRCTAKTQSGGRCVRKCCRKYCWQHGKQSAGGLNIKKIKDTTITVNIPGSGMSYFDIYQNKRDNTYMAHLINKALSYQGARRQGYVTKKYWVSFSTYKNIYNLRKYEPHITGNKKVIKNLIGFIESNKRAARDDPKFLSYIDTLNTVFRKDQLKPIFIMKSQREFLPKLNTTQKTFDELVFQEFNLTPTDLPIIFSPIDLRDIFGEPKEGYWLAMKKLKTK